MFGGITSAKHLESTLCPECGHRSEHTVWETINIYQNPELKPMLQSDHFYNYTCPICGRIIYSSDAFEYCDPLHRYLIKFNPVCYDVNVNKYALVGRLKYTSFEENYSLRYVDRISSFREKLAILDAGFNDIAIAMLKYLLKYKLFPMEFKDSYDFLFVKRFRPNDDLMGKDKLIFTRKYYGFNAIVKFKVEMDLYNEALNAIQEDLRFKDKGFLCAEEEWVKMLLEG